MASEDVSTINNDYSLQQQEKDKKDSQPSISTRWVKFVNEYLPLGSKRWPHAARWVSLLVGVLGLIASATPASFVLYQNAMRAILNQTQTDSNLAAQIGGIGAYLGFPAGMMYEQLDSQATNAVGGIFSVLTFLIFALATSSFGAAFFSANQWLLFIVFFVNGFATCFTYLGSLMPNIENFPFEHRGKVVGFLDATVSLGPLALSFIYNLGFTNGYVETGQEGNQNLSGFFVFLAGFYAFSTILLILFNGRLNINKNKEEAGANNSKQDEDGVVLVDHMEEEHELKDMGSTNSSISEKNGKESSAGEVPSGYQENPKPPNKFSEFPFAELPIWKLVTRWNFYFFMIKLALNGNLIITYLSNAGTFLRSYNMSEYNLLFTALAQSVAAVVKLGVGFLSDVIAKQGRWPRAIVYLGPYALETVALFVSIFYGDNFGVMIFTTIAVSIGFGTTWCQAPSMLGELFGEKHLASNFGWAMLVVGLLGFPYSLGFSAIYEAAIYQPGEIYCYGLECFTWSFALLSATAFCAFIMALGLTQNMFRNAEDRQRATERGNQKKGEPNRV